MTNTNTRTQTHIHIEGFNKSYAQNLDGTPHDKGSNNKGDPPNTLTKELKKRKVWDWNPTGGKKR